MYQLYVVHRAGLRWSGNPTRKRLMAAIPFLVRNNIQFLGFPHMFHTGE